MDVCHKIRNSSSHTPANLVPALPSPVAMNQRDIRSVRVNRLQTLFLQTQPPMPHRTTCHVYLANVKSVNLGLRMNILVDQAGADLCRSFENDLCVGIRDILGPWKVSR